MERVVYVLGAGFSAPLGLPLVSNFLEKAKDQHLLHGSGGASFEFVLTQLDRLARIKNVYAADLDNIEEILSVLEVEAMLGTPQFSGQFQEFIRSVILYYTPEIKPYPGVLPSNWQQFVFGQDQMAQAYGAFVAALHHLRFVKPAERVMVATPTPPTRAYDVVTTNYDCVLENACTFINTYCAVKEPIRFHTRIEELDDSTPALAKLHGSVAGGHIVPPTWSKGAHPDIAAQWRLAKHVLSRAQHIRFIGYSLPEADSYIKYLLKAAVLDSRHLKTIDALCLDTDGAVEARYKAFVRMPRFRFINRDTSLYLQHASNQSDPASNPALLLEQGHASTFGYVLAAR